MRRLSLLVAAISCISLGASAQSVSTAATADMATFRTWAMTPPMGWNSWDCYYSTVTEDIVLQNAQYMADHNLQKYGWEYVVVDIRWFAEHPSVGGGAYNQNDRGRAAQCQLDEYGRYIPSPRRFPSCMVGGKNVGFKPMADKIHEMGLKFGIHIMRGLPKYILDNASAYKLMGSESTPWEQVYTTTRPECGWLQDNLTIRDNEFGQLYYNSIINLYASWGVDFIKVDDISRPFHTDEIRMLRKAIDQCGRPIVLSLSPGKTQFNYVEECHENANMWRMMDDLWDSWRAVDAVFAEADFWSKHAQVGNYADCDMLPLGQISMTVGDDGFAKADKGRWTRLTKDEQLTMMTLWGICHSPLFFGGEMTMNDDFTLSLLTNEEYYWMHGHAVDAHQVSNAGGQTVWTSVNPVNGDRYLALFHRDDTEWVLSSKALYKSETVAYTTDGHAVDVDIPWPKGKKTLALVVDNAGDNNNYDHGDWLNPTLVLRNGSEVALTGEYLTRKYAKSYFNVIRENINVTNNGSMKVLGKEYSRGFSTDANAVMFFTIPDDMDVVRFKATAAADDSGIGQRGATTTVQFMVFDMNPLKSEMQTTDGRNSDEFTVDLTQFGYKKNQSVPVYDIWQKQEIGKAKGTLKVTVPSHGARLLRIGSLSGKIAN